MTEKTKLLKPHLLECVRRLKRFIDLDAPGVIIGMEAWNVFATVLATYGTAAGSTMVQNIRDKNLHSRGVCENGDCVVTVERPSLGICETCCKALGLDTDDVEVL